MRFYGRVCIINHQGHKQCKHIQRNLESGKNVQGIVRFIIMTNINSVIENAADLQKHYTVRDGFVFTSITEPANIFDAIVLRYPKACDCHTPKVGFSNRTLQECIELINQFNIEKAFVIGEHIDFITKCPSLKYLKIVPADTAGNSFDYSPLYELPEIIELNYKTIYGNLDQFSTVIDYEKISGLKKASVCGSGHLNYTKVASLESLNISNVSTMIDLQDFASLHALKSLEILQCGIQSLKGIESLTKLNKLNVGYCRKLFDMSALSHIGHSLNELSIENCSKIGNFNFLNSLTELRRLCLEGKNSLPGLTFLKQMPELKELILWMNALDGDITPCVGISYVSLANHKHYNMRDSDLSKLRQ